MLTPSILRAAAIPSRNRGGGARTTPLVTRACGSAVILTGITAFDPGAAIHLHMHNCEESVIVIEGQAVAEIYGIQHTLDMLDTSFIPANIPHRFLNLSDHPMRIYWTYTSIDATRTMIANGDTSRIDAEQRPSRNWQRAPKDAARDWQRCRAGNRTFATPLIAHSNTRWISGVGWFTPWRAFPQREAIDRWLGVYMSNLRYAIERVAGTGVTILIESISHAAVAGYAINTHDQAAHIQNAFGVDKMRPLFDTFHAGANGTDPVEWICDNAWRVRHIHIADYPGAMSGEPEPSIWSNF